jgi:hypothetical protein
MTALTAHQQAADIIAATLLQAPALADGRVWLNRQRTLPAGQPNGIVVRLDGGDATEAALGALDWSTRLRIDIYARAPSAGQDPAALVDPILAQIWSRVQNANFASLGGGYAIAEPSIQWAYDDIDTPTACATVHLVVKHRTPTLSLAPWV